ncbi:uncharacterized protein V1516DRAFT_482489 [Lipomyces oligophaga]|uniref:uncharacterized protein n=1 Tax=Lipomyces oligophaga TaxID=45792 RepID=UPI0034CD2CF0
MPQLSATELFGQDFTFSNNDVTDTRSIEKRSSSYEKASPRVIVPAAHRPAIDGLQKLFLQSPMPRFSRAMREQSTSSAPKFVAPKLSQSTDQTATQPVKSALHCQILPSPSARDRDVRPNLRTSTSPRIQAVASTTDASRYIDLESLFSQSSDLSQSKCSQATSSPNSVERQSSLTMNSSDLVNPSLDMGIPVKRKAAPNFRNGQSDIGSGHSAILQGETRGQCALERQESVSSLEPLHPQSPQAQSVLNERPEIAASHTVQSPQVSSTATSKSTSKSTPRSTKRRQQSIASSTKSSKHIKHIKQAQHKKLGDFASALNPTNQITPTTPTSSFEPSPRRSVRTRLKPLEYWRNERIVYQLVNDALAGGEKVPTIRTIIRASSANEGGQGHNSKRRHRITI